MTWILYVICSIIIFHDCLLFIGLLRSPEPQKHMFSFVIGAGMIAMAIVAIGMHSWSWLITSYVIYRLLVMLDILVPALRDHRNVSRVLPINLSVIAGGSLALATQLWGIFVISYSVSWVWTLIVGKRLLREKI